MLELLLVLFVAFASSLFAAFHIYLKGFSIEGVSDAAWRIANGVIRELLALAVLLYVLFRQGRSVRDIGLSFRWLDLPISVALYGGAYMALYFAYIVLYYLYFFATGHILKIWADMSQLMGDHFSVVVIVFILINPWFEELIVRGYLMTEVLALNKNAWVAVVLSVGVQSLYHLYQGVPNVVLLAAHFLIFALYYAKTRRILPVILAHFYADAISTGHFFFHH